MKIYDLLDEPELKRQTAAGLISSRLHPKFPLAVMNYTQRATFDVAPQDWNENLRLCRGLIFNTETLDIVARGFRKFWNYFDSRLPETMPENLPAVLPEITTKLDGSLGVYYDYEGQTGVATRGSFESEQALWATKWYAEHGRPLPHWWSQWTPLFEICYAANTIVVQYETEGLHLIGAVSKETGEEAPYRALQQISQTINVPVVERHDKSLDECAGEDRENFEGYVATWRRLMQPPIKIKIKLPEYKRLAKLYSGISPKEIWRMLSEGESFDELIANAPQPYVDWVQGWKAKLAAEYARLDLSAEMVYRGGAGLSGRKAQALYFKQTEPDLCPILFAILDGDSVKQKAITWKLVKQLTAGRPVFKPETAEA